MTKTHASAFDTFRSLERRAARAGRRTGGCALDRERAARGVSVDDDAGRRAGLPRHGHRRAWTARRSMPLHAAGADGFVVAATGAGNTVAGAARGGGGGRWPTGCPWSSTTRCPAGAAGDRLRVPRWGGDVGAGRRARSAGHLGGPKARVALAAGAGCGPRSRRARGAARRSDADPRWTAAGRTLMPLDALVTGAGSRRSPATRGFGWVEAVGITDGRVAFAGSAVELETRADPHTRRIELEPDEVAIPGLTDAHLHLAEAASPLDRIDLTAAATLDGWAGADRRRATRSPMPDAWLEGARLGQRPLGRLADRRRPRAGRAGRAVALWAHDHHALWVSRAALAAPASTPGPPIRPAGSSGATPTARRRASSTRPRRRSSSTRPAAPTAELVERVDRAARPGPRPAGRRRASTIRARCRCRSGLGCGDRRPTARSTSGATCRSGSTPRSGPSSSSAAIAAGLRSGDPLGAARRPGPVRLAEALRRRDPRRRGPRRCSSRSSRRTAGRSRRHRARHLAHAARSSSPTSRGEAADGRDRDPDPRDRRRGACRAALDALEPTVGPDARSCPPRARPAAPSRRPARGSRGPGSRRRSSRSTSARTPRSRGRLWGERAETRGYPMRVAPRAGRGARVRDRRAGRADRPVAGHRRWRSPGATGRGRPDSAPFGPDER